MTSIAAYNLLKAAVKSDYFTAFVVFAAWMAALMSGSVLAIAIGLIAFLRPLLLTAIFANKAPVKATRKVTSAKTNRYFSLRPFALGLAG